MLGVPRSQNARIVGNINLAGLASMGMICGYAHRRRTEATQQYSASGVPIEIENDEEEILEEEEDNIAIPRSLEGDIWFAWFQDSDL